MPSLAQGFVSRCGGNVSFILFIGNYITFTLFKEVMRYFLKVIQHSSLNKVFNSFTAFASFFSCFLPN